MELVEREQISRQAGHLTNPSLVKPVVFLETNNTTGHFRKQFQALYPFIHDISIAQLSLLMKAVLESLAALRLGGAIDKVEEMLRKCEPCATCMPMLYVRYSVGSTRATRNHGFGRCVRVLGAAFLVLSGMGQAALEVFFETAVIDPGQVVNSIDT